METNKSISSINASPPENFEAVATKVTLVSIIGNLLLSCFKLLAGIIARSGAMISDAIHSASDVFSSIIVIMGVKLSSRESDKEHPYGHERFECVAAIILSVILLFTGFAIGANAMKDIFSVNYESLAVPGKFALIAAVVSISSKESMYWYTRHYAKRIDSSALMADAWHHRSDALSSIGALIGIAGARMGFPILDPVASLVICFFIAKAALDIFKDAIDKMVDHSCDPEIENSIRTLAESQAGVKGIDFLQTRVFGNKIYVDIEISADGLLTLNDAHEIAEKTHDAIEKEFPKVKHIMVHVNPYQH
ncbi:MAG: cation diffusion facilitator family transporter [Bariatricus sp.]|nr:cation diffusion facilitator family transporter [Bariatricus sp.]